MPPKYDLKHFIKLCRTQTVPIGITRKALEDAKNDFNLWTRNDVLDFIASGGLENPVHLNTRKVVLDLISIDSNSKDCDSEDQNVDFADAYSFYSGGIFGYFSFFYSSKADRWMIKSFHINPQPDPRRLGD